MDLVAKWLADSPEETREEARLALGLMADAAIEAGKAASTARRNYSRDHFNSLAQGYIGASYMLAKAMYGPKEARELREALERKAFGANG